MADERAPWEDAPTSAALAQDVAPWEDAPAAAPTTAPVSKPFQDGDFPEYQRLVRARGTTPEQLSSWLEQRGYGRSTNAAQVLDFHRKNPKIAPTNTYVMNSAAPTPAPDGVPQPGTPTDWLPDSIQSPVERAGLALGLIDPKTYYGLGDYGENARAPNRSTAISNPALPSWGERAVRSAGETFDEAGGGVNAYLIRANKDIADDDAIRHYGSDHNWTGDQIDTAIKEAQRQRAATIAEIRSQRAIRDNDEVRRAEGLGVDPKTGKARSTWGGDLGRDSADLAGGVVGDANPTYFLAPAGKPVVAGVEALAGRLAPGAASKVLTAVAPTIGRAAGQGAVQATTNLATQADEVSRGMKDKIDPTEVLLHGALGAGFQGGAEFLGKLPPALSKWIVGKIKEPSALDRLAAKDSILDDLPAGVSATEAKTAVEELIKLRDEQNTARVVESTPFGVFDEPKAYTAADFKAEFGPSHPSEPPVTFSEETRYRTRSGGRDDEKTNGLADAAPKLYEPYYRAEIQKRQALAAAGEPLPTSPILSEREFDKYRNQIRQKKLADSQELGQNDTIKFDNGSIADVRTYTTEEIAQRLAANEVKLSRASQNAATDAPPVEEPVPAGAAAPEATPAEPAPAADDVVTRFTTALNAAGKVRPEQDALFKAERAKRFAQVQSAQEAGGGREAYDKARVAMKGEFPRADFGDVSSQFTETDVASLFDSVSKSNLSPGEKLSAHAGLDNLLASRLPEPKQLETLSRVFPADFVKAVLKNRSQFSKTVGTASDIWNTFKTTQSTLDLSGFLRQGKGLIHRGEYWKSVTPSLKAVFSPKTSQQLETSIRSHPNYDIARKAGLPLTTTGELGASEDMFKAHIVERIPVWGSVIRGSERGYVGFLNKLRFDTFNNMLAKAGEIGHDVADPKVARGIARYIGVMTGRGSLGSLEKVSNELNLVLYSPGMVSSRLQILAAPVQALGGRGMIADLPKGLRAEAAKSYAAMAAYQSSLIGLALFAGKTVSTDPLSSEFMKIKDGDTRLDLGGGLNQYVVAGSRALMRKTTSGGSSGTTRNLKGRGNTPLDSDIRFVINKLHPSLTLILDQQRGETSVGEPFEWQKEIISRLSPMGVPDIVATLKEHGSNPGAYYAVLGLLGEGLSSYHSASDGPITTHSKQPQPSAQPDTTEVAPWEK